MEKGWLLRAFQHGAAAWKRGQPAAANPHPPDSDIAVVWDGGWKQGAALGNEQARPEGAGDAGLSFDDGRDGHVDRLD